MKSQHWKDYKDFNIKYDINTHKTKKIKQVNEQDNTKYYCKTKVQNKIMLFR